MKKILEVSEKIWDAIQREKVDVLVDLVHQNAMFVHMGVTLSRDEEIDIIKRRGIIYKEIDFQESTIKELDSTVVLLNKLKLTAIVNGNEVTNPFVVTEVYTKNGEIFKLASMSYTRIVY
ncbi:nuclear transport factor 2 family protein [Niallia sp.]|uniref:nuclear transport factor 2 family protein n=1 Tax=Niallia sp. TaxID=2837523 RepID=UPI00289EEB40|nr:nuclear transport factor 2 family protein [Niallia sp.]